SPAQQPHRGSAQQGEGRGLRNRGGLRTDSQVRGTCDQGWRATIEHQRSRPRRIDLIEGIIDQREVASVNNTVVVEITVLPARQVRTKTKVDLLVVGAVDAAVQVGVTVVRV